MKMDHEATSAAPARRSLLPLLLLPGIAFLLGLAAMAWLLANWNTGATFLGVRPEAPPVVQAPPPAAATAEPPAPAPEALQIV